MAEFNPQQRTAQEILLHYWRQQQIKPGSVWEIRVHVTSSGGLMFDSREREDMKS